MLSLRRRVSRTGVWAGLHACASLGTGARGIPMWSSHAPSKLGSAQYTVRLLSSNDYSRNSGRNIGMNGNANGVMHYTGCSI